MHEIFKLAIAIVRTVNAYVTCSVGNPFSLMVNDPNRVTARGDGLSLLQCGQQASFTVNAPGAQLRDLDIRITGTFLTILPVSCLIGRVNTYSEEIQTRTRA